MYVSKEGLEQFTCLAACTHRNFYLKGDGRIDQRDAEGVKAARPKEREGWAQQERAGQVCGRRCEGLEVDWNSLVGCVLSNSHMTAQVLSTMGARSRSVTL